MAIIGSFRRDTDQNWTNLNPIIGEGEFILVAMDPAQPTTYSRYKAGDGISHYTALVYRGGDIPDTFISSGVVTKPTITDNGDGSITIGEGVYAVYDGTNFEYPIKKYIFAGGTYPLTDQTENYIVFTSSPTPTLTVLASPDTINQSSVIPVFSIYRDGTLLHILDWDSLGKGLVNKLADRLARTERFSRESGLFLTETTGRIINISEGRLWYGGTEVNLEVAISSTDNCEFWYHNGGAWARSVVTTYNNTQYDNGTNLVTLTDTKYTVNWIYRCAESEKQLFYVLGTKEYNINEALIAAPPLTENLPTLIAKQGILVGKIIIQKNASVAKEIVSAFQKNISHSLVDDHESLVGLLGGGVNNHQHLTTEQVALLHTRNTDTQLKNGSYITALDENGNLTTSGDIIKGSESSVVNATLYVQTANKQITGTIEGSLIGTGVGTLALPANFFKVGRSLQFRVGGYMTVGSGVLTTIRIKLGSTLIVATVEATPAAMTNGEFLSEFELTCRSIGVNGSVIGIGNSTIFAGQGFATSSTRPLLMTTPVIVDTTIPLAIDMTYQFGAAGNTVTSIVGSINIRR